MFALCALICFVLALFGVHLGHINLLILGWCFVALHLLVDGWRPWTNWRRVDR